MRISARSAVPALLVALLACATATVGDRGSACDRISCGMGTCNELPPSPLFPNLSTYECDCYPGWRRLVPFIAITPCYIPTCTSDLTCYIPPFKLPPLGSNVTLHPCLAMDCGPEGTCVEDQQGKPFICQCKDGATNSLNDPSLPCTKDCTIGEDGCPVRNPPPPPPPPPSTAPPGNDSSGPTAPSNTKVSACLHNLLLLASLAALHVA